MLLSLILIYSWTATWIIGFIIAEILWLPLSMLGLSLTWIPEGLLTFQSHIQIRSSIWRDEYDSSLKHRFPAWCDRILWCSRVASRVQQLHIKRYEANVSDHRPIAAFSVTVKSFDYKAKEDWKAVLQPENKWLERQEELLVAAREFYVNQVLI